MLAMWLRIIWEKALKIDYIYIISILKTLFLLDIPRLELFFLSLSIPVWFYYYSVHSCLSRLKLLLLIFSPPILILVEENFRITFASFLLHSFKRYLSGFAGCDRFFNVFYLLSIQFVNSMWLALERQGMLCLWRRSRSSMQRTQ